MNEHQINLLPEERQKQLRREYAYRTGVVALLALVALAAAAALLLAPAHVLLSESISTKKERLASIESTLASSDDTALSARLKMLASNSDAIKALDGTPGAVDSIREMLAVSRAGVTLLGFSYTPGAAKVPRSIALSGVAETREALRRFQLALQETRGVASAELPVSAYAKESEIPFVITVVFKP